MPILLTIVAESFNLRHPRDLLYANRMWVFFILVLTCICMQLKPIYIYSSHLFRAIVVLGADLFLQPTSPCDASKRGCCSSSSSTPPPPPPTKRLVVSSIASKVAGFPGPGSVRFRLRLKLRGVLVVVFTVLLVVVELELFSSVVVVGNI